ncbi:MAG: Holliday junction branch migration DNA helicase RuvB [Deltaproteobacteria bacterium]|jgi:Holliday junction DNA helicase RuvB|nr:Holliday junction branch migration DNA helicase RuvB [Deltaproteobacteria bacterium]
MATKDSIFASHGEVGAVPGSSGPFLPDDNVRPRSLDEFIGHSTLKANLRVYLQAARERRQAMDHTIFHGSPGLGKTTLARIMASELGVNLVSTSGPVLERSGDLAAILTGLEQNDLLFVDEIHRMPIAVEEVLYPAMEDFTLDLVVGQGAGARTVKLDLKPFTLVGATTRTGLLSAPLQDRFGIALHLDFYSPEDLARIVARSARILGVAVSSEGALEIGRRARGTPRIANRLLRRVWDFCLVNGKSSVEAEEAAFALSRMEVDESGLDHMDRKLLSVIIEHYEGGPVGLKTLAAACSEDERTLEDIHEPYLMRMGFLKRTSRGRVATHRAYRHLKKLPG